MFFFFYFIFASVALISNNIIAQYCHNATFESGYIYVLEQETSYNKREE